MLYILVLILIASGSLYYFEQKRRIRKAQQSEEWKQKEDWKQQFEEVINKVKNK